MTFISFSYICHKFIIMPQKSLLKALGPGILFASTCIGVSHLVQSTRAGASYGFELVVVILLANLFKYPFFEYASRYANATGTSIIDGYKRLDKKVLWLYAGITLLTMFFVSSAVVVVTSGFMSNFIAIIFGIQISGLTSSVILLIICFAVLVGGKYKLLDSLIKVIGAVLLISTLLAFFLSLSNGGTAPKPESWLNLDLIFHKDNIGFVIALMGWMPTALDLSSWNSLWTVARIKQTGYRPKLKETLFDFNFGYIISALLALCFVTLGANLMYGTGESLPAGSGAFAAKVVEMYTSAIGDWSKWVIGPAAFCIMFGTAIAVMDGYARSSERIIELLYLEGKNIDVESRKKEYILSISILSIITFLIGYFLVFNPDTANLAGFKGLVDIATTTSFIVAPIVAIVNFALVQKKYVGKEFVPHKWKQYLSYVGIVFLTGFSIFYLVY